LAHSSASDTSASGASNIHSIVGPESFCSLSDSAFLVLVNMRNW
jgi:hypothetical protein